MELQTWAEVLTGSFQELWYGVVDYLPHILAAIIIFFLGWAIGNGLGKVVAKIISTLKVDSALRNAGIEGVLDRSGFSLNSGKFLGALVKWFVITVFLVASLEVLGLTAVTEFLQQVVLLYLPQVIVAVLILLVAAVIAEVVQNTVEGAAQAASMKSAAFLGTVARWAIWVFAIFAALNQLGVAHEFVQTLFTGIVIAVSLALGLAFGLGGQDAAADYIGHVRREFGRKHE